MFTVGSFADRLIGWYTEHRRSLPWRGETDPCRIWISEVMLQQTQVETVIPYYRRWIESLPTVQSVAAATQDDLLKLWEGLGYYGRCRNFHRACRIVEQDYGGEIPRTWSQFRKMPGVGDYTAAAVLSIAFGEPLPVIDGNVGRVMARITAFSKPVAKGKKPFAEVLQQWIDVKRPGDFNQAMMVLGSLICRKNQPRCDVCPVSGFCEGFRMGRVDQFPIRQTPKKRPHRTVAAGIIWDGDRFLIQRRPDDGLLGGLWEFPGGGVEKGETVEDALIREIAEETGLQVSLLRKIGQVNHAYTHFSITLHAYHCALLNGSRLRTDESERRWIHFEDVAGYAFPRANHKLFELMREKGLPSVA